MIVDSLPYGVLYFQNSNFSFMVGLHTHGCVFILCQFIYHASLLNQDLDPTWQVIPVPD